MMSLTFGLFNQVSGLGPLGPLVLAIITKGNNFSDFLFAFMDNRALPKWYLLVFVRPAKLS